MIIKKIALGFVGMVFVAVTSWAQDGDRRDVRRGNRHFEGENYKEALVDYQKALLRDSTSFAASYNMANTLYRLENPAEGRKILDTLAAVAPESEYAADYYYNLGNMALTQEDYQTAVDSYKQSLLRNPGDIDAKENYIYAKKKLEDQQNQDQNQNQDGGEQNQDGQDQNDEDRNDENQDQSDDNTDGQNDPQPQDGGTNPPPPQISKQQAQQMINAMLAKEKETQDKVKKEKAEALQSRQKEKNW